ncbi:MAG TPA: RNA-directed DNA polymerase, partial [Luteolibacter sp.]
MPGIPGNLNLISPNLFAPYFSAYGKWRADGLAAMRAELVEGHRIVAVTMDLKRFYHHIDPSFLLEEQYLDCIGADFTPEQCEFTQHLLDAFATWNRAAHLRYGCQERGLPVGLTASSLIANVLLAEFDRRVVRQLSPRHYGRYVDDVFLVLRRDEPFESGELFIQWMADELGPIAEAAIADGVGPHETSLQIRLPYAGNSELIFTGKKQKIFQLFGAHGLDLINPIEEQIRQNTSEFRDLPHLPSTESAMAHRALLVTPDAQLEADALRKADAVTLRRSGFAMLLGDLEAYAYDLDPGSWQPLRAQFYGLAERHLLAPKAFFDYVRYMPRIIGLMSASGDWDEAVAFIDGLARLRECLLRTCQVENGSLTTCMGDTLDNLGKRCLEAVLQAVQAPNRRTMRLMQRIRRVMGMSVQIPRTLTPIREDAHRLILLDWSREPYAG